MSDLLPCPFCGSAFKIGREPLDSPYVGGKFYLYHDYGPLGSAARKCPISVNPHFNTEADAIAAWNRRALPATDARADALREAAAVVRAEFQLSESDIAEGTSWSVNIGDFVANRIINLIDKPAPDAREAAEVIAKNGAEATAAAMILHIAETLRTKGKAVLTTGDDFGAQVLQYAEAIEEAKP